MSYDPSGGLTGWDLTGFHEGHDTECWRRLGANEMTIEDPERGEIFGTRFSVWAPNAQTVRLVGDFNYWNGEGHYMHLVPGAGDRPTVGVFDGHLLGAQAAPALGVMTFVEAREIPASQTAARIVRHECYSCSVVGLTNSTYFLGGLAGSPGST